MNNKKLRVLAMSVSVMMAATVFSGSVMAEEAKEVTVTDMSGDEITISGEVDSIVNLWPAGTSSFFVMGAGDKVSALAVNNPGTMNAWTQHFYPGCVDIPAMGGVEPSVEDIINQDPDLVIIHPTTAKSGLAQKIRDVGIPAMNINFSNYESMTQAYTVLGEVLGGEYQEKLAAWCEGIQADVAENRELTKDLAEEDKPVVYYISGQNDDLLSTMAAGGATTNIMQDWIESNGGIFASTLMEFDSNGAITAEEVFAIDPDVIIVGGVYQHQLINKLETEDGWKELSAVKNGRVYNNPYACFNWDRFGLESMLQVDYALMCIQPEIAEANGINRDYMVQEIIDFYEYYNGTVLTEEQAGYMLDGLQPDGTAEYPVE